MSYFAAALNLTTFMEIPAPAKAVVQATTLYFGNTPGMWLTAGTIALGLLFLAYFVRVILAARIKIIAARTTTRLDDLLVTLIEDLRLPLLAVLAIVIATRFLTLADSIEKALQVAAVIAIALQLILSSGHIIDFSLGQLLSKSQGASGKPDETLANSMGVLRFLGMVVVAAVVLIFALDNVGVAVTPLLTGLGIGGIAIALAVQNVLSDLFASLAILLDKPFVVGDSIQVGQQSGTVERIGVKTTRVRAVNGEQLVFANNDLLKGVLQNFKRMEERRVAFTLGLSYRTPPGSIRSAPNLIAAVISAQANVRFDRCHIKTLGEWAIIAEVVYFVTTPDHSEHVRVQHEVNLALLEQLPAAGIAFAFPTQITVDGGPV